MGAIDTYPYRQCIADEFPGSHEEGTLKKHKNDSCYLPRGIGGVRKYLTKIFGIFRLYSKFTRSPIHPFTHSPIHPFTRSPPVDMDLKIVDSITYSIIRLKRQKGE